MNSGKKDFRKESKVLLNIWKMLSIKEIESYYPENLRAFMRSLIREYFQYVIHILSASITNERPGSNQVFSWLLLQNPDHRRAKCRYYKYLYFRQFLTNWCHRLCREDQHQKNEVTCAVSGRILLQGLPLKSVNINCLNELFAYLRTSRKSSQVPHIQTGNTKSQ